MITREQAEMELEPQAEARGLEMVCAQGPYGCYAQFYSRKHRRGFNVRGDNFNEVLSRAHERLGTQWRIPA